MYFARMYDCEEFFRDLVCLEIRVHFQSTQKIIQIRALSHALLLNVMSQLLVHFDNVFKCIQAV